MGRKTVKKIRQPLLSFKGAETLSVSVNTVLAPMPDDRDEGQVHVMPEDIVLDLQGNFAIEVILSAERLELLPLPQRLNSVVYIKDSVSPVIIIEAFPMSDNVFPVDRFRPQLIWVEGHNFFLNHDGRI